MFAMYPEWHELSSWAVGVPLRGPHGTVGRTFQCAVTIEFVLTQVPRRSFRFESKHGTLPVRKAELLGEFLSL